MQNPTNIFIANLAFSDVLMCCFSVPFTPIQSFTGRWLFGRVLCTLFPVSISPTFYEQLFLTKVFYAASLYLQFGFVFFWLKNIGTKAACKMLVKLTTGVNFINVLWVAFAPVDPKSVKIYWQLDWILMLLGTTGVKAVRKMLVKLTTGLSGYLRLHLHADDDHHRARQVRRCLLPLPTKASDQDKSSLCRCHWSPRRCQFNHHFTSSFFVQMKYVQFSLYHHLLIVFLCKRKFGEKLLIKCR